MILGLVVNSFFDVSVFFSVVVVSSSGLLLAFLFEYCGSTSKTLIFIDT